MAKVDISTLPEPPIGAHLITSRKGYNHHGLYIGRGKVIHYSGMALYKIGILLFNLAPLIAIYLIKPS